MAQQSFVCATMPSQASPPYTFCRVIVHLCMCAEKGPFCTGLLGTQRGHAHIGVQIIVHVMILLDLGVKGSDGPSNWVGFGTLTSTEKMLLPPPSSLVEGAAGVAGAELGEATGGACSSQSISGRERLS